MKYLTSCILFLWSLFSCADTKTEIISNTLAVEGTKIVFQSGANEKSIPIDTDLDIKNLHFIVAANGASWCEAGVAEDGKSLVVRVKDNQHDADRVTVVSVTGKNQRQDIEIRQKGNTIPKDFRVEVARVAATSFAEEHEPEKMIDGDFSTYFNSKFGAITDWPFMVDFFFEEVDAIDYFVYTPRPSGTNAWGSFGKVEVFAATKENPSLTKVGESDFQQTNDIAREFRFENSLVNPTQIQIRVHNGYNDRVSCSEMQFFAKNEAADFDYRTVFTDGSCSNLKDGISQTDIDVIPILFYKEIAQNIFDGKTDPYRVASFRPYRHPDILAAENKTRPYSLRDNATGIYVKDPNDDLVVLVGDTHGQEVKINIFDFQNKKEVTFSLKEGLNVLTPSLSGLIYIYNHTEEDIPLFPLDDKSKKKIDELSVNVQIMGGLVNGYYDVSKHKSEDWTAILENASFTEIDVLGAYSHVVWTVADYKKYNTDIALMTNYMDSIVRQQQEFMGLYHYNRLPTNRMFIHIDYSAPAAYATHYRTAYNSGYANVMCSEEGLLRRMWVLGHELGHVNQVTPGVKWHGTTEVTNNLYAMYNQFCILGEAKRLFDNPDRDGYGFAFTNIIGAEQPFLLPDNFNNHIPKVAPFWQLYLYFVQIKGEAHFYHDLYEYFRTHESPNDPGLQQLDFVRQVCNIGKTDLTDFFIAWGFLRPIDRVINDYGNKQIRITQQQIDDLVAEIKAKKYPEPPYKVEDITDNNYLTYKNR